MKEKEREKQRKTDTGTQALMEQGYFISRNAGLYISLVRWLLSYYIGWNFINSHNMDRLIQGRWCRKESLKGVTERNPSRYPFPWSQSWELCAVSFVPVARNCKEQRIYEKWKTAGRNPPVNCSLTVYMYVFFSDSVPL